MLTDTCTWTIQEKPVHEQSRHEQPRREPKDATHTTIHTTLFDLAAAIDAVCEPDDDQIRTMVLQHILNSRRVTMSNGRTTWRVICDDAELSGVDV